MSGSKKRTRIASSQSSSESDEDEIFIHSSFGKKDAFIQMVEKVDNTKLNSELKEKLECPVCLQITLPPIMQCRNGHITCNNKQL